MDCLLFAVLTVISWGAIARFFSYWSSINENGTTSLWYALLTILIVRNIGLQQILWFALLLMQRPKPVSAASGLNVAVVTTFVPNSESVEMLEETLKSLVGLQYTHDTWCLDEGSSQEAMALCSRLGVRYFSRSGQPKYQTDRGVFKRKSKHGNYNAWLFEIGFEHYDVLVNFDLDHVPRSDFLLQVLGYFRDPSIGYVQAAQAYYNQPASFISRGAAEETYSYYSNTQMAYHGLGHPVVTGCHTAQRMSALIDVGGFAAHDADDLLITLMYRSKGWKGVYVPKILAVGVTPVDWTGYIKQQSRWAYSVLDVKLRAYPRLVRRLPLIDKIVALMHGLYYLQGLEVLFATFFLGFTLSTGIVPEFVTQNMTKAFAEIGIILGLANFYKQRFFLLPANEWGIHWRSALLQLAKWPFMLIGFIDALIGKDKPYTITLKTKSANRKPVLFLPHVMIIIFLLAAVVFGQVSGNSNYLPLAIYIWTSGLLLAEVVLLWSETKPFPPPFEAKYLSRYRRITQQLSPNQD